jgi:hypothetical protein
VDSSDDGIPPIKLIAARVARILLAPKERKGEEKF